MAARRGRLALPLRKAAFPVNIDWESRLVNVANVEVLPIPMLPVISSGVAARQETAPYHFGRDKRGRSRGWGRRNGCGKRGVGAMAWPRKRFS